jgi:CelD/BcsL family acetyltransferase involved in cellulose biosynthesis
MDNLSVQRVTTAEGLAALQPEWQRLLSRRPHWLPFQTPQWHAAWWTNLPERCLGVTDRLFACALRDSSGELVGVAPVIVTQRPGVGPFAFRALDFIGPDPNLTEMRGLISHPEHEAQVFRALRRYFHEHQPEWQWIHWRGIPAGSEADEILSGLATVRPQQDLEDFVLRLPATWEELRSSRPRNLKESLRKCYNSLKRDGHSFALEVASNPAAVGVAVERLFALHGARAQVTDGVVHRNVFADAPARAFVLDVCHRLAERGATRVFELRIGAEVVASRIGFILGDSLYLYYSGYDPKWGDYSVMTTTVAEALKYAIANGLKEANLSFGADVSKTRWDPERVAYRDLIELAPSVPRRFAYEAYEELRRVTAKTLVHKVLGRALRRNSQSG